MYYCTGGVSLLHASYNEAALDDQVEKKIKKKNNKNKNKKKNKNFIDPIRNAFKY